MADLALPTKVLRLVTTARIPSSQFSSAMCSGAGRAPWKAIVRAALSRLGAPCALGCLVALAGAAPASAATATTLAGYSRATPVSAYRDAAVWSAYDDATERYTLTLKHGDTIRGLPLPSRENEFDATVGRGAGGRVLVAYADCPTGGRCGVYGFDPERNVSSLLHASARRGVLPESPSVWGNRVVWVEARGERKPPTVFAARTPGGRPRVIRRFAGRFVGATALMGDVLALRLGLMDGNEQIQVQRLDGTRRRVVGHTRDGENDQRFAGLSFVGRSLYWARLCAGDPCHGVAFRYRDGRFAHARLPRFLVGFAMASSGAYWVTGYFGAYCDVLDADAQCQVQHAALRFQPGRDPGDGP
jgi:hypothetical protein